MTHDGLLLPSLLLVVNLDTQQTRQAAMKLGRTSTSQALPTNAEQLNTEPTELGLPDPRTIMYLDQPMAVAPGLKLPLLPAGAGICYCLATDGEGTWLAGGTGSSILKSTDDGLNWYVSGTSVGQVNGVEYNNGVWFIASNTSTSYRATTIADRHFNRYLERRNWSFKLSLWAICHIEGDTWMTAGKLDTPSNPFLSTDNCASWSPATSQGNGQIMGLASDGTTIVVTDKASKIYTSTDNGSSWTLRHTSTSADVLVVDYNKVKPFDICT